MKFELQYKEGQAWQRFAQGTEIGVKWSAKFEPVTARLVRLNILQARDGPSIREPELFAP